MTARKALSRILTLPPLVPEHAANKGYVDAETAKVKSGRSFTITSVVNTNASSFAPTMEVAPPSSAFQYIGCRASDLLNVSGSGAYGNKWKNGGTATYSTTPWGIMFHAARTRYVEFMVAPVGNDASMRLFVDGVEASVVPLVFPSFAMNVFNTVRIDLGAEPRTTAPVIRADFSANMLLGRVWVDSVGAITPAVEAGLRYLFHGDSLMQGETQNTGGELGSYIGYMSKYLGSADIWNSGIRGSGPNQSSTNGGNFKTRATSDVANSAADVVVMGGFFNDRSNGRTPAQVAADMAIAADTILAMPNRPLLIVMGSPDPTGGSNAAEWATFDSAIQTAMQARNVPYISQSTGQITSGNGVVLATQGPWITNAMAPWFLGSDGLHPTDLGHQYLAARMWQAFSQIKKDIDWRNRQKDEFVTASANYTIVLPSNPIGNLMRVVEVRATAAITVTVPASVRLTTGLTNTLSLAAGKSAFFGLRYSASSGAWYLMSATAEQ